MGSATVCGRVLDERSSKTDGAVAGRSCPRSPVTTITPERLRDGREIAAVLGSRHQRAGRLVVVHLRPRQDERPARVAVVASRRVGGAVQRNRAKRLLREAARHITWPAGVDVVLIARAASVRHGMSEVRKELLGLQAALFAGAGVS